MGSNYDNIEEFYNLIKEDYPDLTLRDLIDICKSPFKFIKEVIGSGVLKNIRYEYLGVFEVSTRRLKYKKKSLNESLANGTMLEETYNKRMKILNSYEE